MKIRTASIRCLALGSLLLSGCLALTPPATPAESRGLTVVAKSSPRVLVRGPRLQMNRGHLELAGQVAKQPFAATTAFSHLDVVFTDRAGGVVAIIPIRFAPRSLGMSRFSAGVGYYRLPLDTLPASAVSIEVKAHDADLKTAHSQ